MPRSPSHAQASEPASVTENRVPDGHSVLRQAGTSRLPFLQAPSSSSPPQVLTGPVAAVKQCSPWHRPHPTHFPWRTWGLDPRMAFGSFSGRERREGHQCLGGWLPSLQC